MGVTENIIVSPAPHLHTPNTCYGYTRFVPDPMKQTCSLSHQKDDTNHTPNLLKANVFHVPLAIHNWNHFQK